MMLTHHIKGIALTVLACAWFQVAMAQQSLYGNRVVSKYFTGEELRFIEENDSLKFIYLTNLYLHSYQLEPVFCSYCKKCSPELFDINVFNHLREKNQRVTVYDSLQGFKVILLSHDELELMSKTGHYNLDVKTQTQQTLTQLPAGFPVFIQSGNIQNDVQTYLAATEVWAKNNPTEYADILKSVNTIHFIRAADFLKLSATEQQSILGGMSRCVILSDSDSK